MSDWAHGINQGALVALFSCGEYKTALAVAFVYAIIHGCIRGWKKNG
jgi:hypothetical protein